MAPRGAAIMSSIDARRCPALALASVAHAGGPALGRRDGGGTLLGRTGRRKAARRHLYRRWSAKPTLDVVPLRHPFQLKTFPIERLGVGAVQLELRAAITDDFDAWVNSWQPLLQGDYSVSWPWEREIADGLQRTGRLVLAVAGDSLEALMSLSVRPARGADGDLLYVEYVQAAPWNERSAGAKRRFAGLGGLLLVVAAQLSREEGLHGRLGLHSKQEVEGFYERHQLRSYGPDSDEDGFVYFEGGNEWAYEFLKRAERVAGHCSAKLVGSGRHAENWPSETERGAC